MCKAIDAVTCLGAGLQDLQDHSSHLLFLSTAKHNSASSSHSVI